MALTFVYTNVMGEAFLQDHGVQPALLSGYRRSFNHSSAVLWGNEEHACPVLGLSPGGECWGLVIDVPRSSRRTVLDRLGPPEGAGEYRRAWLKVKLRNGELKKASAWISKPRYARADRWPDPESLAEALIAAHGKVGRGVEYVRAIAHALQRWQLSDPLIESLWERLAGWRPR